MELQGTGRRMCAGACALAVAGLAVVGTASPGYADDGKPSKPSTKHSTEHTTEHTTEHKAEKPHTHKAAKHKPHSVKTTKAEKNTKTTKTTKTKTEAPTTPVRRPSALLNPLPQAPATSNPQSTPRVVTAPVVAPVPSVVLRPVRARGPQPARVSAASLLDLTTVVPGRAVSARRQVVRPLAAITATRGEQALAAVPRQVVSKAVPPIGSWPSGPVTLPSGGQEVPMAIALGGLVLALAAARGVSRMRHPRVDNGDLAFPTS